MDTNLQPIDPTPLPSPVIIDSQALEAGGHVFKPVVFGKGEVHKLSQREAKFLDAWLASFNLPLACMEIGITQEAGKNYLKKPHIKRFVDDMLRQKAFAAGLTIDKLLSTMNQALDGTIDMTPSQRDAMKTAAKVLRPSGSQININQNTINVPAANSPYAAMSMNELATELKEKIPFMESGK